MDTSREPHCDIQFTSETLTTRQLTTYEILQTAYAAANDGKVSSYVGVGGHEGCMCVWLKVVSFCRHLLPNSLLFLTPSHPHTLSPHLPQLADGTPFDPNASKKDKKKKKNDSDKAANATANAPTADSLAKKAAKKAEKAAKKAAAKSAAAGGAPPAPADGKGKSPAAAPAAPAAAARPPAPPASKGKKKGKPVQFGKVEPLQLIFR